MTQEMGINPLMDFARKTECSVKLPSQGLLYDDDNITFNTIGEVDIRPMLPNDEMMIVNPESLISGDAIISIIKSCCPSIKRPEELYYPDVNVLLLGIKKATYGDDLTQEFICPNCWAKKNDIEHKEVLRLLAEKKENGEISNEVDEEVYKKIIEEGKNNVKGLIADMEKEGKILISPQEFTFSIETILNSMTFIPQNNIIETKDGLKIYINPYKCMDKIKFSSRNIKQQKIYDYYKETANKNKEDLDDYMVIVDKMSKMYIDLTNQSIDIVSSCIPKIELPDNTFVTNKEHIREYIKNCDAELIKELYAKTEEVNNYGIQNELTFECGCCGHNWTEKFYGFNQTDFFGISS